MSRGRTRKNPPGEHDDFTDDEFGNRARIRIGSVEHRYPAPTSRIQIDLISSHGKTADRHELLGGAENLFCQLRARPDADDVCFGDVALEILVIEGLRQMGKIDVTG